MKIKWRQFFQDNNGENSMSRLLPFMAFPFATIELFRMNTESALDAYLGAFVIGYLGGKCADAFEKIKGEK